jgi:hypothetical protein
VKAARTSPTAPAAYSTRASWSSRSLHGHSYKVELLLQANALDRGQMVYDFGLLKGDVRDPKLLPVHDDCLAMYFPSWINGTGGYDDRNGKPYYKPVQQFITFSDNGHDWQRLLYRGQHVTEKVAFGACVGNP